MIKRRSDGFQELRSTLKKLGWESLDKSKEWVAQGVVYANFQKNGKVIHVEYGSEDCVLGEVEES